MSILLDFDMDFFVRPIYKESRDNHRDYLNEPCQLMPMESFFKTLQTKNLYWDSEKVKLFTNHKKSYTFWWTRKYRNCTLIHIDAHSDFYRPKGRDLMDMGNGEITCYNFIWYSVRDGFVNKVYWVLPADHELMEKLRALRTSAHSTSLVFPLQIDLEASFEEENHFNEELLLYKEAVNIIHHAIDPRMPSRGSLFENRIVLECPVCTVNGDQLLEITICPVAELPVFSEPVELLTAATSPEFISAQADQLLPEFCQRIKATEEMCRNIQMQHEDMKSS